MTARSAFFPWPPSVNTYWRHPTTGRLAGRHIISKAGREYRDEVCKFVSTFKAFSIGNTARVRMRIKAFPPDHRRRDLDNILKAILDSLVHAGAIGDDSQIDDLQILRAEIVPYGAVMVVMESIEECS